MSAGFLAVYDTHGTLFFLMALRLAPALFVVPWLALPGAGWQTRVVVGLAFAAALFPAALLHVPSDGWIVGFTPEFLPLALRELVLGLAFALGAGLPLFAFQWSGQLTDRFRGHAEERSPLGQLALLLGAVLFFMTGAHRLALRAFAHSLEYAPLAILPTELGAAEAWLGAGRLTASALAFAAVLAAPAAVAIVIVEFAHGFATRRSPDPLGGAPLRATLGLLAMLLGLGIAVDLLPEAFRDALAATEDWMRS